ncbi:MAG: hypothetical protein R2748_27565 [Bryobacterales bacterium]
MFEPYGLGRFSGRQLALLWLLLSAGLLLRLLALDWGLPPTDLVRADAGLHDSYARGEGDFLEVLAQPSSTRWATPQRALTLLALEAADIAGAFDGSWREAWQQMRPGAFERVYAMARLVTVALNLLAVYLIAMVALRLGGVDTALWAAALAALAPGLVLEAGQIRPETMVTACALLLWLAVLDGAPRRIGMLAVLVATALAGAWVDDAYSSQESFLQTLAALPRFWLGVPTALLAVAGAVLRWRRSSGAGRLFSALAVAAVVLLGDWLTVSALCLVAAAVAVTTAGRWGRPLGAAALFVAASASFSVVSYRIAPHPINMALLVVERVAKPGDHISRLPGGRRSIRLSIPMHAVIWPPVRRSG